MSVGNVVYNLLSQLEPLPWFTNLGMTLENKCIPDAASDRIPASEMAFQV